MEKQFVVELLEELLVDVARKVENVRHYEVIASEVKHADKYDYTVTIVRNKRFELGYNTKTQQCELHTTYSNLEIDDHFMQELNELSQKKAWLAQTLKTLQG